MRDTFSLQRIFCLLTLVTLAASLASSETTRREEAGAPPRTLNLDPNYRSPPLPSSLNPKCEGLIKKDGTYGERGLMLIKELKGEGQSTNRTGLMFPEGSGQTINGMQKHCPNFNSLSDDQKMNFWVWMMAATASAESGCDSTKRNDAGTNGPAIGEYQTPETENGKSPAWRGPGCATSKHPELNARARLGQRLGTTRSTTSTVPSEGRPWADPEMQTPEYQAACAIEVLSSQIAGKYHSGQPTLPTEAKSHWEVLMDPYQGKRAVTHSPQNQIHQFEPCGASRSDTGARPGSPAGRQP